MEWNIAATKLLFLAGVVVDRVAGVIVDRVAGVLGARRSTKQKDKMDTSCILQALSDVCSKLNTQLKDQQVEVILKFCQGHDVFVSLPTGFGKSMIYGLLPLLFDTLRG